MESTKLGKFSVIYPNNKEYHAIKREIWNQDSYHFESKKNNPFIVDIGAHIGISVLYFKDIYPNSEILAFEPNPISFEILKENIQINGLRNITLVQKAIYKEIGTVILYIDDTDEMWGSNSSLKEKSWNGLEKTKPIQVQSTTLQEYVKDKEYIDMLKIDTEGTELSILNSNKHILSKVQNISVEYHPSRRTRVKDLLNILNQFFITEIYREGKLLKNPEEKLLTIKGKKRI
ncbi:hypothetical protein A3K02_01540 [candidate division WS6 bacterium RIFOXYD1_FULL_33_8]|uniref:Methyltransferase FkbM family protein n=1 Tax=candidate division WS6 bacterium GW2011_GWB1_33_6 TaxID=1619088 RepID=A0A0G0CTD8_9BACT|nr:MAG: Methyltransferase FkbM family protein [candidate division WS6 bacterium GW2011_GWB1_33_6]OGC36175.1 MAG: hypothetical protein A2369_00665 [candidate division WS6 bacterium RIFOXYB1_FULL_33_15]OGC42217.1 MAG: hypothetical protein A3K02_01540 [candidate division WS6 bacterium RIFOXYD1_FULL_33_8]